jgi:hypothetical protein
VRSYARARARACAHDVTEGGNGYCGEFKSKATSLTTQTTATLSGRVNPDGQTITECKFEYGTSTSLVERALAGVEV